MEQREQGGARPGAGRKPHSAPGVKRTVTLTAEADAVVQTQRRT